MGKAYGLSSLPDLLRHADIVISATGAHGIVVNKEMVEKALKQRRRLPLFLVDIALPRDIAPEIGDLGDTYLFDIDDLKQVVDDNKEQRRLAAQDATVIIQDVTKQFVGWLETHSIKPALAGFREYLDQMVTHEFAKTLSKEAFSTLTDKQRELLASLSEALATKLTGEVGRNMNSGQSGHSREALAEALKALFNSPGTSTKR